MAGGSITLSNANENTVYCKKCKTKLVSRLKCKKCASYYHPSCARQLPNMVFNNDDTITCCESQKNGEQEDIISNTTLIEAITTGDKVDVNIFVYILEQKDQIIKTLKEEITLLNEIYLMAMTGNKNLSKAEEPVEKKKDKKQPLIPAVEIAEYKQILTDTNFVIFDFIHL
jgi:hypothetical protein